MRWMELVMVDGRGVRRKGTYIYSNPIPDSRTKSTRSRIRYTIILASMFAYLTSLFQIVAVVNTPRTSLRLVAVCVGYLGCTERMEPRSVKST